MDKTILKLHNVATLPMLMRGASRLHYVAKYKGTISKGRANVLLQRIAHSRKSLERR